MAPPKLREKGINLNTALLILGGIVSTITIGKVILPLAVVPERVQEVGHSVKEVRRDVDAVAKVQAVQTEALKRLTDIAAETQSTRREVDRHGAEIQEVRRRLDRLESSP